MVLKNNKVYILYCSDLLVGRLYLIFNYGYYMFFEDFLRDFFLNYNCCLLIICISIVLVFKKFVRNFKIFVLYFKDLFRMFYLFGKCILFYIEGMENFELYL